MYRHDITFVLFAFNEAKRIERAVKNFLPFGQVLVVDNESIDGTVEIARGLGASVLSHKNPGWVEDEGTTEKVLGAVSTRWVYWAYADEMVDHKTLAAIFKAMDSDKYEVIGLSRRNYYYGEDCFRAYSGRLYRVFVKGSIDFSENKIHHFGRVLVEASKVLDLDPRTYYVHHFISSTTKAYLGTSDRYTDTEAQTEQLSHPIIDFFKIVKRFLANHYLRGGWKAGRAGLFFSVQTAIYQMILSMKAYEKHHRISIDEIERKNNIVRDKILYDFGPVKPVQVTLTKQQLDHFKVYCNDDTQVQDFINLVRPALPECKAVVDVGGGPGFFALKVAECLPDVRVHVIDTDPESVDICIQKGLAATVDSAIRPSHLYHADVACLNLLLHHLVGSSEAETHTLQADCVRTWGAITQYVFVNELCYESYFSPDLSAKIIYTITRSTLLSRVAEYISRVIPSLRANTFGTGVRFRSHDSWKELFQNCNMRVVSASRGEQKRVAFARRLLLIKSFRQDSFLLSLNN